MKEIKSIFFRVIFNLPLGFLFLKILGDMSPQLCLNQINMESIFYSAHVHTLPAWFWATIYLSLLLLVGEIVSTLGEWLINWLFEFPAFWSKREINLTDNYEKIMPCGETYVSHKKFVTALNSGGGIGDFSELHFALSRLLAGAAWLCLLLLLSICTLGFIILLVISLVIMRVIMKCRMISNWTSFFMLLLSLVFILILSLAKYLNFYNLIDLMYPILLTILTVILLFAACIYRSVANVINYAADKT